MGFFDFLKRNKTASDFPTAAPASAAFPAPVSDQELPPIEPAPDASESPLLAMARIVTGDDAVAVDGLRSFFEDESAFADANPAWYRDFTDDDMSVSETERQRLVFTRWLIDNHQERLYYGSYMDRKQQPEYMLDSLQWAADRLGYPLRLKDVPISEDDGRSWEEQLEIVDTYVSEQGYELVPLYDQWAGFYLFLAPQGGFNELYKLGRTVGFDFTYPF